MPKFQHKSYIKSVHGRVDDIIHYNLNGYQYIRSFSMPRNPRTEKQQKNRATFAEAVKLWQGLSERKKSVFNRMAAGKPQSGYNIFVSMQMKGIDFKLLKRIVTGREKFSLISVPYFRGTSVISPTVFYMDIKSPLYMNKKPPGTPRRAA